MAEAIVSDKFTFANGDTGVVLAMQSGDFASSDFVLVSRSGTTIGRTIIFPKDGSTSRAKAKGTPPQALVKGRHIGYLWASVENDAADYLPLRSAGRTAHIAAGLWQLRLSHGYRQQLPPLQTLDDSRHHPEDRLSGMIEPNAVEDELPSLERLKAVAQR